MKAALLSRVCFALILVLLAPLCALGEDASAPGKGIAKKLQPFVDNHTLAGAVTLVADKDKVLSAEAVGFADVEAKKPMKTDSIFWIASQSKPITAAAFMILVDEGKVKLDEAVEKYLPEFKEVRVGVKKDGKTELVKPEHAITIREILSHTSGLPFTSKEEDPTLDQLTLEQAVKSYAKTPLLCQPGTEFHYSNAGINTAGRLIEVLSGMSYESFLDKRLFGPLGMKDTTFWPNEKQIARLAKSYKAKSKEGGLEEVKIGQLKYPLDNRERQPMPAGGLFSTAADVARFCQMVLNKGVYDGKRILSEDAVKQMTSKQTGKLVKSDYGLGWNAGETCGHGGAYSTHMGINRKTGLITVWMVQQAGPFPGNGGKSRGVFEEAAKQLGKSKK